jgi:hypothetical protein
VTIRTTSNERTLAGLAHLSVLLGIMTGGIGGAIAAMLIWITQKDKSDYVAFQALQAAVYQIAGTLVMTLAWCCWLMFYFATFIPMMAQLDQNPDVLPPSFWIGLLSMVVPLAVMGLWLLYGLWGSLRCFQGLDFQYVFVGRWVKRYLMNEAAAA